MTNMDQQTRLRNILNIMEDIKNSKLSENRYFKEKETQFKRAQYYNYKRILKEDGVEGIIDQRSKGNNLKFTNEMKFFTKGLLKTRRTLTASEVIMEIEKEFLVSISEPTINNFRRENNLEWMRPEKGPKPWNKSGAAEISIALALGTGIIETISDVIYTCVQKMKKSAPYQNSMEIQKDRIDLRNNGRFTSEYNNDIGVRMGRFKSIDEKIPYKRFVSMKISSLSKESIRRYSLALFSLPLVTYNGRVRSVNNPKGNALKYLCGFNYKMATLEKYIAELKYLKISNELIGVTAKFWIDFWSQRNKSDNIFVCYYIDGNTKALWSSKACKKTKVTMLGRVMNSLEQVFIHDGRGHPVYFQTFSGHADLGKNALGMTEKITKYLNETTDLEGQFTVNRILVMDAGGNAVKTLREISNSPYHYITILDSNQVTDRKIKHISEEKRYEYGDASLVDCKIELKDSDDRYLFETRAVQVNWDNGKTSVLVTSLPEKLFSIDNVVKSYFDRWPFQELGFKNMKSGVHIHRVVGYGKRLVDNVKVLEKIEKLQDSIKKLEDELMGPLNDIQRIETGLGPLIEEERIYREKSTIKDGERKFKGEDEKSFKAVRKRIDSIQRKIKKIERSHDRKFKLLKIKRKELARIIDKKKIYQVDVELDQIMTCFKVSFVNICSYFLEECLDGERMTLERLFETVFNLTGKYRIEGNQRTIHIDRNLKQEDIMRKLEQAFSSISQMEIRDLMMNKYNFNLV